MKKLNADKQFIMELNDQDVHLLLELALGKSQTPGQKLPEKTDIWFEDEICGLSNDAQAALSEAEEKLKFFKDSNTVEKKWLRYARKFGSMKLKKPEQFEQESDPKMLYQKLRLFCLKNDFPVEIISQVVPFLVGYMETGRIRPIILIGDKGSGKTTCARCLMEFALSLPVEIIKVPESANGHGLTGDCQTYKSADLGSIAKAQYKNESLILGLVIDEIDKVPNSTSQATIDDELLSITDESVFTVEDKYLESRLVGLPYCPIMMTGNELSHVNPVLADRCTIIQYPNPTPDRMKSIMKKYAEQRLKETVYSSVSLDVSLMFDCIDRLLTMGISSIRQHQQVLESVLNKAFVLSAETESTKKTAVTRSMFDGAAREIMGNSQRHVGF